MRTLLENCQRFASDWKLEFNPKKSVCHTSNSISNINPKLFLSGQEIPSVDGFIYLGLPVGNLNYLKEYFDEKMKKIETFFSLRGLGCKPVALHPKTIAFLFKEFCQSIVKFGLENTNLSSSSIRNLNIRQSMMVKIGAGISTYCKTCPLIHALKIDNFGQLYLKHKIFFLGQIGMYPLVYSVFDFLNVYYANCEYPKGSFMSQLKQLEEIKIRPCLYNKKASIKSIDQSFACEDAVKVK